jgi:hypothetical protein
MHWILLLAAVVGAVSPPALGQVSLSPFAAMMEAAKTKSVIDVDTSAGKTRVLLASAVEDPRFVFVFAPGGEGAVDFSAGADGKPTSAKSRNPSFLFAPEFLRKQAAWAIIALPEDYGQAIQPAQRLDTRHIEAISRVGRRVRETFPRAKLVLIGHSNGGISAGLQAIQPKPAFDAVVMSAPNLAWLPRGWNPDQAHVPMLFITHKSDQCKSTAAYRTIAMAGDKYPVAVIDSAAPGSWSECNNAPAPHFFSGAYGEYADAILKWAAAL